MDSASAELNTVSHPNWYYDVPTMRTLILGSFPPDVRKWNYSFYYPNKANRFWKILAEIAHTPLTKFEGQPAVDERIALMERLQVGVQNIGRVVVRKGKSAKDEDIEVREFQDILQIVADHPTLVTILLPGLSGPSSTFHSFVRYLNSNGIQCPDAPEKPKAGDSFFVDIGRPIRCVAANSTSTQALRVKFESLVTQFRSAIV